MKKLNRMIAVLLVAFAIPAMAQQTDSELKSLIETKAYVFEAQSMLPQRGGVIQLTSSYTLKVKGDTLHCDLPYVGRAYQATYGGDTGLKFDSHQYDYSVKSRKKGGWDVKLQTHDLSRQQTLYLSIFEDGNASLNVSASDRQAISYRGNIKKIK